MFVLTIEAGPKIHLCIAMDNLALLLFIKVTISFIFNIET